AIVVLVVAAWRHGPGPRAWGRGTLGIALGAACLILLRPASAHLAADARLADPQGALALLPAFQLALYVGLCVAAQLASGPFAAGLALLGASQVATLAGLHVLAARLDIAPHVRDVRAWAIVAP